MFNDFSKDKAREKFLLENPNYNAKCFGNGNIEERIKTNTRVRTWYAIKRGDMVKKPCQVCGDEITQVHHKDYSDHLNVLWLCKKHHMAVHRKYNALVL